MSYSGENQYFSFRDGFCESLPNVTLTSAVMSEFGRTLSGFFSRFCAGCCGFSHTPLLYALCSGISECGHDVFVCENTDLPSFRFGIPLLSADCGVFISGNGTVKISFFTNNKFPFSDSLLTRIMNGKPSEISEKYGKITVSTSFCNIYVNNIRDTAKGTDFPIKAGISCGNRAVRSIWLEFFSGEDEKLIFQISDDGMRVNAYSEKYGFISFEKLTLAYSFMLAQSGKTVFLPQNFHYGADISGENGKFSAVRFSPELKIPDEAVNQRFLNDPLFMCVQLTKNTDRFYSVLSQLPSISSAKRELAVNSIDIMPLGKTINEDNGRIIISRSGKNRISLLAQSLSAETASEICSSWTEKLREIDTN